MPAGAARRTLALCARSSSPSSSAALAAAGSIVYVKDGNVWVARPDGSEARALTTGGTPQTPYGSPSQADDLAARPELRRPRGPARCAWGRAPMGAPSSRRR